MAYEGQPVPSTVTQIAYFKVNDGNAIDVPVPENTTIQAGLLYYINGILGFATKTIVTEVGETTATVPLDVSRGKFETDQINPAEPFAFGAPIYWDSINNRLTEEITPFFAGLVTDPKDGSNVIHFNRTSLPNGTLGTHLVNVVKYLQNHIQTGLLISAPTTASSHADAGAFDFNVNIAAGLAEVSSIQGEFSAQADYNIANGGTTPIDAVNTDIIYAIVLAESAGSLSLQVIAGNSAPSGDVTAPTDADVSTSVGHSNWIWLGSTRLHRSGAAACTQTVSNIERPKF